MHMAVEIIAVAAATMFATCSFADVSCKTADTAFNYPSRNTSATIVKREFRNITDAWARQHHQSPFGVTLAMRSACLNNPDQTVDGILHLPIPNTKRREIYESRPRNG